ncbi:ATPase AAA [Litchfieldella qijiaojingensis]|uniref:ATPase AAA n=1 Tax=Litchfieldella qijiaojingensis TaxID=980347 RepID=A0ABQ2YGP6_9GAMM|nr:AAA family ATPase [Halomonas qijiaojingensis]GGX82973.1 ATPase AAA [Halomonas qijiaojingensis]
MTLSLIKQDTSLESGSGRVSRPSTVAETGLDLLYLADLLSKQLYEHGVLDLHQLSRGSALAGSVVEEVCNFLRDEGRAEVRGAGERGALRFGLTDRGRAGALEALGRDGYAGVAPVTLDDYTRQAQAQAMSAVGADRERVHEAFADTVITVGLLDQLGPALHSGRAMFLYGDPGTGKSFISRRLSRLLPGEVLVPYAILVAGKALRCFDPAVHEAIEGEDDSPLARLYLENGHDPRYVRCRRPCVVTGGELTLGMLEVQYDAATHIHHAPLQLRANNGMLVIDDLGRQRMEPMELFNRWIVPMEERHDYLTLSNGQHFRVPFDVALVFSTNLEPLSLADPAFLRRIGYKIRFEPLSRYDYLTIWQQECDKHGLAFDEVLANLMIDEWHAVFDVPLLPCHPRDLIGLAMDYLRYQGQMEGGLSRDALEWAWQNYFGELGDPGREAS